jgi:hypothetical protein
MGNGPNYQKTPLPSMMHAQATEPHQEPSLIKNALVGTAFVAAVAAAGLVFHHYLGFESEPGPNPASSVAPQPK